MDLNSIHVPQVDGNAISSIADSRPVYGSTAASGQDRDGMAEVTVWKGALPLVLAFLDRGSEQALG